MLRSFRQIFGARRRKGIVRSALSQRRGLATSIGIALLLATTLLPAGIGNVGKKGVSLSGGSFGAKGASLTGSFVRVTLPGGVTITHTVVAGQTSDQVRDILVSRINSET